MSRIVFHKDYFLKLKIHVNEKKIKPISNVWEKKQQHIYLL